VILLKGKLPVTFWSFTQQTGTFLVDSKIIAVCLKSKLLDNLCNFEGKKAGGDQRNQSMFASLLCFILYKVKSIAHCLIALK
jgi:hypothetical protein